MTTLRSVLPQLRDIGRVRRGYLGMGVNDLTNEAAEAFGALGKEEERAKVIDELKNRYPKSGYISKLKDGS